MNEEESRIVPLWQLKQFSNTLRMVSNTLNSPKRESCLDRNVMRDWNEMVDMINESEVSQMEHFKYYMEVGQIPKIIKK